METTVHLKNDGDDDDKPEIHTEKKAKQNKFRALRKQGPTSNHRSVLWYTIVLFHLVFNGKGCLLVACLTLTAPTSHIISLTSLANYF